MGSLVRSPHRNLSRIRKLLALGVLAAVALSACGGSHKTTTTGQTETTTTSTAKRAGSPTRKGLVTVDYLIQGYNTDEHFRVTIYDLRRHGPFVTLDFGYRCADLNAGCHPGDAFTLPQVKQRSLSTGDVDFAAYRNGVGTPNGVRLIDPVANKEYFPVSDGSQRPDTSKMPDSLNDTRTYLGWVTFAGPAAGTSSMDVLFPNGGPQVSAVPISAEQAPTPQELGANVVAAAPAPFATQPGSTDTTGLTLPVQNLVLTVGNPTGSDAEAGNQATITLSADVLFHFDKSNLTPAAHAVISHVASEIKARAVGPIQVTGYTDSIGTNAVNIPLSHARAQSVITALTPLTPGASYQAAGKGSADPVAPNRLPDGSDNPAGRRLNRRVTIAFQAKAPARPAAPPATTTAPPAAGTSQTIDYRAVQGDGSTHNYTVRVDQAYRNSNLLVVRATVTCMGAGNLAANTTDPKCDGYNDFVGSPTVPPESPRQNNQESWLNVDTISTLYLDDPATGSQYIPVSLPDHQPATAALPQLAWTQGQSYPVWAYFPAPPATSTKITLTLASGGSTQIPIAPSPPALASSGG